MMRERGSESLSSMHVKDRTVSAQTGPDACVGWFSEREFFVADSGVPCPQQVSMKQE